MLLRPDVHIERSQPINMSLFVAYREFKSPAISRKGMA